MFSTAILTALLLALTVAASPVVQVRNSPITLPCLRRVNTTSARNLLHNDRQRAIALKAHPKAIDGGELTAEEAAIVNQPVDNQAVDYIASVGVGSPPTTYDLIIDTGSSNTWIGAGRAYVQTPTSVQTENNFQVFYGSGLSAGTEYTDTVTLGTLTIPGQSIGVATVVFGFGGVDGILGVGPVDLTQGTLFPANDSVVPTVTDNLFNDGSITRYMIGIFFEPSNTLESLDGEITWGGTDSSKLTGAINFAPRTSTSPASLYWGIDQSVRYGYSTTILASTAGIVDTGTTLILIASDAFASYQQATGAAIDPVTGLLFLTPAQFQNLESLFFTINGVTYELTPNAQIWPRALNSVIRGSPDNVYLIVSDIGGPSGEGLDFINGKVFLERYYSAYNSADGSVGFATTHFTRSMIN